MMQFGVVLFEICTGQHPGRWRQEFTGVLFSLKSPAHWPSSAYNPLPAPSSHLHKSLGGGIYTRVELLAHPANRGVYLL